MTIKITAGIIVHTISISCASVKLVLNNLDAMSVIIMYNTNVLIKRTAISVWSWK